MERKKYCIFACGGHGVRMGGDIPKQFLRISGKTILQMSIEKIVDAVPGVKCVVVLPKDWMQWWKDECMKSKLDVPQTLICGGITRFHSVRAALDKIPLGCIVGVHDAVRPLCTVSLVARLYDEAAECGAVAPVIPVTDTLKVLSRSENGVYSRIEGKSADRSVLFGAQTPQVFSSDLLRKAYSVAYQPSFTDDASVVEASGYPVCYIDGERNNVKITTPEDLLFTRFVLGL